MFLRNANTKCLITIEKHVCFCINAAKMDESEQTRSCGFSNFYFACTICQHFIVSDLGEYFETAVKSFRVDRTGYIC